MALAEMSERSGPEAIGRIILCVMDRFAIYVKKKKEKNKIIIGVFLLFCHDRASL